MSRAPVAAILTLGCKLNLADSEHIARGLRSAGYDVVDRICEADAFVVNTCSVTHVADQKSRRLIRSVRRMAPEARVAVTGCYPQSAGFDAAQALGADLVVGTKRADQENLVTFLAEGGDTLRLVTRDSGLGTPLHTRAFVKAQEGCNDVCAFCIVPQTRGREESRSIEDVVADVQSAVEGGAKEVVITGTQLGAWGRELEPALKPHHLIAGILERADVLRLRFSSLQPQDITPELLALWQDPRLMPHFHLALQSGSEAVLKAMRRRYSARDFVLSAERIRAAIPDVAITTDVIAAFPGETDEDFEDTLALCREVGFARLHCFPYSQRARTTAARMPGQLPPAARQERMQRLLALGDELAAAFRAKFEGATRPVLWEEEREFDGQRYWHGHTDNYIEVYGRGSDLRNRVTPVRLGEPFKGGLLAREEVR